mgnify:CR=1 FL=1
MKNNKKVDPRDELVPLETLERIADSPDGGSGVFEYTSGRIQSMARELLAYRKKEQ